MYLCKNKNNVIKEVKNAQNQITMNIVDKLLVKTEVKNKL